MHKCTHQHPPTHPQMYTQAAVTRVHARAHIHVHIPAMYMTKSNFQSLTKDCCALPPPQSCHQPASFLSQLTLLKGNKKHIGSKFLLAFNAIYVLVCNLGDEGQLSAGQMVTGALKNLSSSCIRREENACLCIKLLLPLSDLGLVLAFLS